MTILYVNGDSHSAGHDAGGVHNSYGSHLARLTKADFTCQAVPACGNDRIIRTTRDYLKDHTPDIVIIGWSTWEREEWEYDHKIFNISSGIDINSLPTGMRERYKEWVITNSDSAVQRETELNNHNKIWALHCELNEKNIKHLFFNCYSYFHYIKYWNLPRYDWGNAYVDPYDKDATYYFWLENAGFKPANPAYYHYGPDAHIAWANFLLPKLNDL